MRRYESRQAGATGWRLAEEGADGHATCVSTVTEIKAAIEQLPPGDYRELLAWIEEHQAMIGASEALFAMYDEEEAHAQGETR